MTLNPKDFTPAIGQYIFNEEEARQESQIRDLVARNYDLGGSRQAFICAGRTVSLLDEKSLRGHFPRPVVNELHDEAHTLVKAIDRMQRDKRKYEQTFNSLLRRCHSMQDVRDLLPDILATKIGGLNNHSRTREMTFLLQDNALLKAPYDALQDVISYYIANRLIY
jgi:hypothetical protein